jgi:hypothetical protein
MPSPIIESFATPPELVTGHGEDGDNPWHDGDPSYDITHAKVASFFTEIPPLTFFARMYLTEVQLPVGLRVIAERAFYSCPLLCNINFPSTIEVIEDEAFRGCGLTSLAFSEGLRVIGSESFLRCENLKSVRIPSTVDIVGWAAFCQCLSLTSVSLSKGLKSIGGEAFASCEELPNITIPCTVKSIGVSAFEGCLSLRSVELSHGITYLGRGAFHDCQLLSSIVLPTNDELTARTVMEGFTNCRRLLEAFPEKVEEDYPCTDALRNRFCDLPIHYICYFHAHMGRVTARVALMRYLEDEKTSPDKVDACGMTPFHILALSAEEGSGSADLFRTILEKTSLDLVLKRDMWGNRPLHYICLQKSEIHAAAIKLIQELFQMTVVDRLKVLGLERWRMDMKEEIDLMDHSVWLWGESDNRRAIDFVHRRFEVYERMEVISLIEMAIWKMGLCEMNAGKNQDDDHAQKKQKINELTAVNISAHRLERNACRVSCGFDIIIYNVLPFLGPITGDDDGDSSSSSGSDSESCSSVEEEE